MSEAGKVEESMSDLQPGPPDIRTEEARRGSRFEGQVKHILDLIDSGVMTRPMERE